MAQMKLPNNFYMVCHIPYVSSATRRESPLRPIRALYLITETGN